MRKIWLFLSWLLRQMKRKIIVPIVKSSVIRTPYSSSLAYSYTYIYSIITLEVIHIVTKFQKASPAVHRFQETYDRSHELQNHFSLAREELYFRFHGGLYNGLA